MKIDYTGIAVGNVPMRYTTCSPSLGALDCKKIGIIKFLQSSKKSKFLESSLVVNIDYSTLNGSDDYKRCWLLTGHDSIQTDETMVQGIRFALRLTKAVLPKSCKNWHKTNNLSFDNKVNQ